MSQNPSRREEDERSRESSSAAKNTTDEEEVCRGEPGANESLGGLEGSLLEEKTGALIVHPLAAMESSEAGHGMPGQMRAMEETNMVKLIGMMESEGDTDQIHAGREEPGRKRGMMEKKERETGQTQNLVMDEAIVMIGVETGVTERRWKRKIRGAWRLEGEGGLAYAKTPKRKDTIWESEEPAIKLPRRKKAYENNTMDYPDLVNLKTVAAGSPTDHNNLLGVECSGIGEYPCITKSTSINY